MKSPRGDNDELLGNENKIEEIEIDDDMSQD